MKNGFFWVVVIAVGVFIGIFAYGEYQEYRTELATRKAMQELQLQQQKAEQQARVTSERNRLAELRSNTMCALNEETSKCTCIHKKTGMKISKSQEECRAIVSNGTR